MKKVLSVMKHPWTHQLNINTDKGVVQLHWDDIDWLEELSRDRLQDYTLSREGIHWEYYDADILLKETLLYKDIAGTTQVVSPTGANGDYFAACFHSIDEDFCIWTDLQTEDMYRTPTKQMWFEDKL